MAAEPLRPVPWRDVVRWSLLASLAALALVLFNAGQAGRSPLVFLAPGDSGPSAAAVHADFPDVELPHAVGYDGQQYYAIARQPMHPDKVARDLDHPAYRLRRIGLPVLGWALHPTGGGRGLILALLGVGIAALVGGSIAMGVVATSLGGPSWAGAAFPIAPGLVLGVRLTTPEPLAMALSMVAVAATLRRRPLIAVLAAVGAAATKESALIVLVGLAIGSRERISALAAGAGIGVFAAIGAWASWTVPADRGAGPQLRGLEGPFAGIWGAVRSWSHGHDHLALLAAASAVVVAGAALIRAKPFGPLWMIAGANLGFLVIVSTDVLAYDLSGPRTVCWPFAFGALGVLARPWGRTSEVSAHT